MMNQEDGSQETGAEGGMPIMVVKQPHVECCAEVLAAWAARRSSDTRWLAPPRHNIGQVTSRVNALLACLDYMQRSLSADLHSFQVLDVGCGRGGGLRHFLLAGFHSKQLYGIELFEDRVSLARQILPGVEVVQGDATDMSCFATGSFDLVCEQFTFCHITDDVVVERISREMLRVVKKDGYIIVFDWVVGSRKAQYNAITKRKIEKWFRVGDETELLRRFRGQLYPPVGRFISTILPFLYPLAQAILPFTVGSKLTLLKRLP
jgi:SAM-dependent methyltransferase